MSVRETSMVMDDQVYDCVEVVAEGKVVMTVGEFGVVVDSPTLEGCSIKLKAAMVALLRPAGKTLHQMRVERFMRRVAVASGRPELHVIRSVPGGSDSEGEMTLDERKLRARLMLEEVLETINDGLGLSVALNTEMGLEGVMIGGVDYLDNGKGINLIALADGVCDIKVTATGTLSAAGIKDNMLQVIVDAANLRKFGGGGYMGADGKWVKPVDFVGPEMDISRELDKQRLLDGGYTIDLPVAKPLLTGIVGNNK